MARAEKRLPAGTDVQRDFSGGQIDWEARRRDDGKLLQVSLKTVVNWRPLETGGLETRPGSRVVKFYTNSPGNAKRVELVRAANKRLHTVVFYAGGCQFLDETESVVSTISGAPWNSSDLENMRWDQAENTIVLVSGTGAFAPRVLAYSGSTWALGTFTFRAERDGGLRQAYYRFEADGITMRPSARTGSISVDFSSGFLTASHNGVRFRYAGCEVQLTGIVTSSKANATVIQQLPPTLKVFVRNTRGLRVGDYVEGTESGAYGEVTSIDTNAPESIKVVMLRAWSGFKEGEVITGERFRAEVYAPGDGSNRDFQETIDPGDSVRWDEALMSAARGWPTCVRYANNRLIFSGFPQAPNGILWSSATLLTDFMISGDADAAIFELIPGNVEVYDVVGETEQFAFTNGGVYWIPAQDGVVTPGTTKFRNIATDGVANSAPAVTSEGICFIGAGRRNLLAVVPRNDEKRPYQVVEISAYHTRLATGAQRVSASTGDAASSRRFVYVRKSDGSIVMGRSFGDGALFGWFPWTFSGTILDIATLGGDVRYLVDYGNGKVALERLAEGEVLDGAVDASVSATMQNYAGKTVTLNKDGKDMGTYVVHANGSLIGYSGGLANSFAGFARTHPIEWTPKNVGAGEAQGQRERRRRSVRAWVDVKDANGFTFWGLAVPDYKTGENTAIAPVKRDTKYRRRKLGRNFEPVISVDQTGARSMKVLELGAETTV